MSEPDPADELLTPQKVAAILGVQADTVRKWARAGVLPSTRVRPGSHRRFRRGDVEDLRKRAAESDQPATAAG